MNLNDYQSKALKTDISGKGKDFFEVKDLPFLEQLLGLVGETGEFADKMKKILREKDGIMTEKDREEAKKELGDVLWYLAVVSKYLGYDLDDVAKANIDKLASRAQRGTLKGSGDNR